MPKDLAFRLAPIAGLRNRIVHKYDKLDKGLFIRTLRKEYIDFQEYNREIEKQIKNSGFIPAILVIRKYNSKLKLANLEFHPKADKKAM